jgi:putative molybdopterin biosynthesis protein
MLMNYSYLENKELDEALEYYKEKLRGRESSLEVETLDVPSALDRITSGAVYARISSPHYNASAMDGIAVNAHDTFGATDTTPIVLKKGVGYEVVDTGDPLPEGRDAVIMVEDVIDIDEDTVRIISAAAPWQHIRQVGEDLCQDEMVVPSNTRIEPSTMGAMLAGGISQVEVWKLPRVGIIPTGDEIVAPKADPLPGEILEFNSTIFSAMVRRWGGIPVTYPIVPDRYEQIKGTLEKAVSECDIVILNAGSSAGRDDYSSMAIGELGEVHVHGIAIKPGKPTILGTVHGKPVIGVPGYPVSGIIVLEKIVKEILETVIKSPLRTYPKIRAVLSRRLMSTLKYEEYVRMKLGRVGGKLIATPLNRGAGVVSSFVKADALFTVPMNTEGIEAGEEIELELLKTEKEIENTLVVTGSHDPLIDVAFDLMRRRYPERYVSSSHVGSMGGIMAIKRGEAHVAGIHLLDEGTGEYNKAYIDKYLKGQDIVRIRGVRRSQGLMIAKGNPLGIEGVEDLARDGLRYVNRQKGSGTRILLDYLLKKAGMDKDRIYGYDREELTHMSVAIQVATGSADCGMGIYSAAKIYGLDFIPICDEEYDFIAPAEYIDSKLVRDFLGIIGSEEFRDKLVELGGYSTEGCGTIL